MNSKVIEKFLRTGNLSGVHVGSIVEDLETSFGKPDLITDTRGEPNLKTWIYSDIDFIIFDKGDGFVVRSIKIEPKQPKINNIRPRSIFGVNEDFVFPFMELIEFKKMLELKNIKYRNTTSKFRESQNQIHIDIGDNCYAIFYAKGGDKYQLLCFGTPSYG